MTKHYSPSISLSLTLRNDPLEQTVGLLHDALQATNHSPLSQWKAPLDSSEQTDTTALLPMLRTLDISPPTDLFNMGALLILADGTRFHIAHPRDDENLWDSISYSYSKATASSEQPEFSPQGFAEAVNRAADLCRHLLNAGVLVRARLFRQGNGAACLPAVPVIGDVTHLIVCLTQEAEAAYDAPEAMWGNGWDAHEQYGDKHLLLRASNGSVDDIADDAVFVNLTLNAQFAMARAAKPKLTEYYTTERLTPEVRAVFEAGEGYLNYVGYLPDEQLVEYSGYLDPGFHVRPWEISRIDDIVANQSLPDATPVKTVRIVFFTQDMADREKRPLLDVGARVFYMNPQGDPELLEVTK